MAHGARRAAPARPAPRGSPSSSPARGARQPLGFAAPMPRGEDFAWRRDKDSKRNEQLSVPVFLPGLPPTFT